MFGVENSGSALDEIAHVIQVALTPVFLLSGIATLFNVLIGTRLARVVNGTRVNQPFELARICGDEHGRPRQLPAARVRPTHTTIKSLAGIINASG